MHKGYFRQNGIRFLVGILISVFFILIDGMGWMKPVYDWGNYVTRPIQYWFGQAVKSVNNSLETVTQIGTLRSENHKLEIKNAELDAKVGKLKEIEKENEVLRDQLSIEVTKDWDLLLVRVLSIDKVETPQHVVIDAGSDQDVKNGDVVVIGDLLIGTVTDVYKRTSKVRLLSNKNSNIVVMDQNTSAKGLLHGSLEGVIVEEILENETVNKDDILITWSDEIPKGLVAGRIKGVEDQPTSSTKKAFVDVGLSYEDLDYAFVVLDY